MTAGEKLNEVAKGLGLMHGMVLTMMLRRKIQRVVLVQVCDTLKRLIAILDEVIDG